MGIPAGTAMLMDGWTPFEASCVHPYLFETAPGGEGGILAGYDRVPNPFVLAAPWDDGRLVPEGGEAARHGYAPNGDSGEGWVRRKAPP